MVLKRPRRITTHEFPALILVNFVLLWVALGCGSGAAVGSGTGTTQPTTASKPNPNFLVWDATLFQAKPDLSGLGIKPLTGLYASQLWTSSGNSANPPDPRTVETLLQQATASTGVVFIDIENWPLDGSSTVFASSRQKYMDTLQAFQAFSPSLKFGYYSVAPLRDYWDAIGGSDSPAYKVWQARNDEVAPIAGRADVLYPSIYTFYTDRDGWKKYAIAQIEESHRIGPGKPVYVFLCPQFEVNGVLGDYLPADYWRMELETARQYADGVVIWGGWKQAWDSNAPWWTETQSFLKEAKN